MCTAEAQRQSATISNMPIDLGRAACYAGGQPIYACERNRAVQLLFKQRIFSWFDSYDIYNETGAPVFEVKGKLAWGHLLEIYDTQGNPLGRVREEMLALLPRFALYLGGNCIGQIKKKFTLLKPVFILDVCGWRVQGDFFEWEYDVLDATGNIVIHASKQLLNWADAYAIDVPDPRNALLAVMIVLAIDAAKCS